MLMEADLVRLQRETVAAILQRIPVLDVVRILSSGDHDHVGRRRWTRQPPAMALANVLLERVPELGSSFANDVLELAVHWLAPSRIGATIVTHAAMASTGLRSTPPPQHVRPRCRCRSSPFSALTTVLHQPTSP